MPLQPESKKSIYSLHDADEQERRRALLQEAHIAPLTEYVTYLRTSSEDSRKIPDFDPLDGGTKASVLFLLEAPGRKAVASGFISRDNPDPTARNMTQLLIECGLQ
jgi:uracil-DNA glycosylase